MQHIKGMADLGYGHIGEVVNKASDYAVYLKKRPSDKPLSVKWFKSLSVDGQKLVSLNPDP